jgi:hypothetical protein
LWPQLSPASPPIRLYGQAAIVAQGGTYLNYGSTQSYVTKLLYAASAGETPAVLAETPITDAGLQNESERGPDFDGTWLVWQRADYYGDATGGSVMAMTLAERVPQTLSTGLASVGAPAISGGRVVFAASPAGQSDSDIELFDLATSTRSVLTFAGVQESAPDISGDWVVYERREVVAGDAQVRAVHLPDGVLDAPSDGLDGSHTAPAIDGTHVVWTRLPPGATPAAEVWWYDLATRERHQLGSGQNPRIDGTLICWDGSDGVWLADSASGRSARVATEGTNCDLSGRRVAWIGHQGLTYRDLAKSEP